MICLHIWIYDNFNKAIVQRNSEIKTISSIKCLTTWFQIKNTLQLLLKKRCHRNLTSAFKKFWKRDRSFYNKKSLTAIRQVTLVWIFRAATSSISCEDLTELIFSIDQWINHFFPLRLPFRNFTKHTKHVLFLLLVTWWIMWLFLHGCTNFHANVACKRLSAVFWVNFCGYFILLVWYTGILKQYIVVDIYLAASRLGKYPPPATSTAGNNC